ncbi:hypothetical protein ACF3NT_12030 [Naumannella halotolerans]|uniref:hypothetical protein n=1 Tax=Naumannella halotolerans TaxID=993414 RepID=UPI00370DA8C4
MATIIDPNDAQQVPASTDSGTERQEKKPHPLALWLVGIGALAPIAFVISVIGLAMTSTGSIDPGPVPVAFMVVGMMSGLGSLAWIFAVSALRT